MADGVHYENQNKLNARNMAAVFAPNMTQMSDPLTALIHTVQLMNFLKALIVKTLQYTENDVAKPREFSFCPDSPRSRDGQNSTGPMSIITTSGLSNNAVTKDYFSHGSVSDALLRKRQCGFPCDGEESFCSVHAASCSKPNRPGLISWAFLPMLAYFVKL